MHFQCLLYILMHVCRTEVKYQKGKMGPLNQKLCDLSMQKLLGPRRIGDLNPGLCCRLTFKRAPFSLASKLLVSHIRTALLLYFPSQIPDIQIRASGRDLEANRAQPSCFPALG